MTLIRIILLLYISTSIAQSRFNSYRFKVELNSVKYNVKAMKKPSKQVTKGTVNKKKFNDFTFEFNLPLNKLNISSPYGLRVHPIDGKVRMHYGIDLRTKNEPIKSVLNSVVIETGYNKYKGNYIVLESGMYKFYFLHLNKILVIEDQYVKSGETIGISGKSGNTTGHHLHLAIKKYDEWISPIEVLNNFSQIYINQNSKK